MNVNVCILCMFEDTASLCTAPIVCSKNWYVGSQDYQSGFCSFGIFVYNRATVCRRQNIFKIVVHVIIIDQCYQTAVRRNRGNGDL